MADLVLIPCRPSAFDLAAIKTTVSLVRLFDKPAFVVFTAGPPHAPRMCEEAAELVRGFGIEACPNILPDRAVYRHASAAGEPVRRDRGRGGHSPEVKRRGDRDRGGVGWACQGRRDAAHGAGDGRGSRHSGVER